MKKFAAGIHALISKDDKYLFLKRQNGAKHDPSCWDLPGGGIELGEQPSEAIIRETREEAGIDIKAGKILSVVGIPGDDEWSIDTYIEGEYQKGEVKISSEHSDFTWVRKDEIKSL